VPRARDAGVTVAPEPTDAAPPPPTLDAAPSVFDAPPSVAPDAAVPPVMADAMPEPDAGAVVGPVDAEVVPAPPVAHERLACLATVECGTQTSAGNRLAYAHAVGDGANRYLVVAVAVGSAGRSIEVSYGGAALTLIGGVANGAGTCQVGLYGLAGPLSGSHDVAVTVTGAPTGIVVSAASFINVDQAAPYRPGGYQSASGTGPQVRASAPSGPGEMTVDAACATAEVGLNLFTPAAPSVPVFDALIGPGKEAVHSVRPASAAATTMSYRAGGIGLDWATGVVSLRPLGPW
jgi:hypothetical protein